jgi:hypothetical protein
VPLEDFRSLLIMEGWFEPKTFFLEFIHQSGIGRDFFLKTDTDLSSGTRTDDDLNRDFARIFLQYPSKKPNLFQIAGLVV